MAEIDEVSKLLGELAATNKENGRRIEAIFAILDAMRKEHSETLGIAKESVQKTIALEQHILHQVNPHVEDYKRVKQRGIGALIAVGLVSGGIGASLAKLLPRLWS